MNHWITVGSELAVAQEYDETALLLATVQPTPPQRRLAWALAFVLLAICGAATPFATMSLPQVYPVVSAVVAICFFSDLITAVLLFAQFSIIRSYALLILACGYLFAAGILISDGLTYPGLFSPTGLLGAGLQTATWLYIAWHLGFPAAILGYTLLKDSEGTVPAGSVRRAIGWSVAATLFLVCVLTLLFTAGNDIVPSLALNETTFAPWVIYLGLSLVLFTAVVFGCLWVRQRTVLDQWLLLAIFAFLLETLISNVLNVARFSVGFYVGVVFLVFNATVVLVILLTETTRLYARNIRALHALQRERQNKLINLEAMAASISHEVKQPLSAILANSDAAAASLERIPPDVESASEALRDIESDVLRTSGIFESIRTLFGRADQRRDPVDLNQIAAEALRSMRNEIEEGGVDARTLLEPKLPHVPGDRGQLLEVVVNMISNAIEAMNSVEGRDRLLTIESRNDVDRGVAILDVRDTGLGMDPGKTQDIFDAFFTTKRQGMGLGLAISRRIAERHGGQISASSAGKNQGALFQLVLPFNPATGSLD